VKPGALTVEWCGSCHVEFDADLIADYVEVDAGDDEIRAAIESDASATAYEQSPASSRVRGITDDHIAAVRAALKERSGE